MAERADENEYIPKTKKEKSEEEEKRWVEFLQRMWARLQFYLNFILFLLLWFSIFRRKKLTPGSLLKAIVRSGGGDAKPADGDQVLFSLHYPNFLDF